MSLLSSSVAGTVGATTDLTFQTLTIRMQFSRVPCGGTDPTPNPPRTETFSHLRYRARNDIGAGCVAGSRVDYDAIGGNTGFSPLLALLGQQILLPQLDAALLPVALAAQNGCPAAFVASSGGVVQCASWGPL